MEELQADTDCTRVLLRSASYDQLTSVPTMARTRESFICEEIYWLAGPGRESIGGTEGVICQEDKDYSRCA